MTKQDAVQVVIKAMQHRMKGDYGHDLPPEEFWISAEEIVGALADAGVPLEGK